MKKICLYPFLLTVLLFVLKGGISQERKVDSLKIELTTAQHDSTRYNLYIEIGDAFRNINLDSSLYYYHTALELSKSVGYTKKLALNLRKIAVVKRTQGKHNESEQYYLEALKISQKERDKRGVANAFISLGLVYHDLRNYDLSLDHFNKSLQILTIIGDSVGISRCYNNIGMVYRAWGDYDKALEFYQKSMEIVEKTGDLRAMAAIYNNLGTINYSNGEYLESIENYEKSKEICQSLGDKSGMINGLYGIANAFQSLGQFDKAIEKYQESQNLFKEMGFAHGMANSYIAIGMVYMKQGLYDTALENMFAALRIHEEIGDRNGIALSYGNIGIINFEQNNYNVAAEYLEKTLLIYTEIGMKYRIAETNNILGSVYDKMGNTNLAIENYERALTFFQEVNNTPGLVSVYTNLGVVHQSLKNIQKSKSYYYQALNYAEEINDEYHIALVLASIASLYIEITENSDETERKKFLKSAIDYSHRSMELAHKLGSLSIENEAAKNLMHAYEKSGNLRNALKYTKQYISTKDSMFNEDKTKALTEMQTKYETEKKQQEIEKQLLVIEKQEIDNRRQRTQRNFFIVGTFLLALLALVVFRGYQQKKRSNAIITLKNAELEQANEEISAQRDLLMEQKEHIEHIHGELTSSIRYARRIQSAVLPASEQMTELLGDHFVLFKPKDIVSGDFFWATRVNQWLVFCVADCTGHGVPGAFMSMLGVSFLNEIVHKENITVASEILNHLRDSVIGALKQKGEGSEQKDGMDMGICVINSETKEMQFAGGYNPCWIIPNPKHDSTRFIDRPKDEITDDDTIIQIKPDKMPIAIHKHMEPYTNHTLQLYSGDQVYLLSDGFQDQFGGPNGKKFMVKKLREMIVANAKLPLRQQCEALEKSLEEWMGNTEQVDDITILGIKV